MDKICNCKEPHEHGSYDQDELVAMPLNTGKWSIIHIPCGKIADSKLPTD